MTPEGFPDFIDKAKQIWNGVRLYWEGVWAEYSSQETHGGSPRDEHW